MPAYSEPTWGTPEQIVDTSLKGASIFAASKSDMIALVMELLKSWFKMEDGLKHPLITTLVLRDDSSSAAGLRIKAGVADEVNVNTPCIYVYSAGQMPIHTFLDKIGVTTTNFSISPGGRNGMEYIVLHVYADRPAMLQALVDECQRFWSMMQAKLPAFCSGLIDIVPQKGEPMSVDDKGRLNARVPANYISHWLVVDLPEDGY